MTTTPNSIRIKPYSLGELAAIYGIGKRTMNKWISMHQQAIGPKMGRLYTALQVKIIFEKLGIPGTAAD